jgi:dolichol kinase
MALSDIRSEIPRTFFHVLGGLFLAFLGYVPPQPVNHYALAFIFGAAFLLEGARLLVPSANRLARIVIGPFMRPNEEQGLTGALPFTGGVLLAFLLFPKPVALAAMVPLVVGDRAGLLAGKGFGRFPIGEKTLEGSLACFAASFITYSILTRFWPDVFDYTWIVLVSASIIGTLAEALPRPFDDNLTIPLAVGVFLSMVA